MIHEVATDPFLGVEKAAKALGDRNRLQVLRLIAERGCIHCTECMECINLAQPSVSHHIKVLSSAGLITTEKEGRFIKLSINKPKLDSVIAFLEGLRDS